MDLARSAADRSPLALKGTAAPWKEEGIDREGGGVAEVLGMGRRKVYRQEGANVPCRSGVDFVTVDGFPFF